MPSKKTAILLAVLAIGLLAIPAFLNARVFIDFSRKNPAQDVKEYKKELKLLKKGDDVTNQFTKKVIFRVPFGSSEETLGLGLPVEPPLDSYVAPGAMAVARNGDIYLADPLNKAIKVYSQQGKFLKKIPFDHDLLKDFGLDAQDNLYVLGSSRLYKKEFHQDAFQALGPSLNEAHNVEVTPQGHAIVLDYTLPPNDNLRTQKLDKEGKVLQSTEQHNFDLNMFEFEDEQGRKVGFFKLGGGPAGAQYKITRDTGSKEEVIYEGYVPEGYYYRSLEVLGFDKKGDMYFLRIISPDIPTETPDQIAEKINKTEVWVDILDISQGKISSVRLEPDMRLYGEFATPHIFDVDIHGNIYQMQADTQGVVIIKYSKK